MANFIHNKWNPRDLESYCKDVEDPVEFAQAVNLLTSLKDPVTFEEMVFRVPCPTALDGMKDYQAYSYQAAISRDPSSKIVINKSRQTGISVCTILDHLHRGIFNKTYACSFVSYKKEAAEELLTKMKQIIMNMDEKWRIPLSNQQQSFIQLANGPNGTGGARYRAFPCKDATARGMSCDLVLDEAAFMPNDEAILAAAMSSTVRAGYRVRMLSTPYGNRGAFARIVQSCRAYAKGEYTHDQEVVAKNWSLHEVHWTECPDLTEEAIRAVCPTEEAFRQEYNLEFLDEATALLTYETLMRRTNADMEQYSLYQPVTSKTRKYIGIDPASEINEMGFVVAECTDDNQWFIRHVEAEPKDNDKIVMLTQDWVRHIRPSKIYVDQNNIGKPLCSDLERAVGSGFVEGVPFSNQSKEWLVYNLIGLFESNRITIPDNAKLRDQLHALESGVSDIKMKKVFTGKVKSDQDDLVWATCLAVANNYLAPPQARASLTAVHLGKARQTSLLHNYGRRRSPYGYH